MKNGLILFSLAFIAIASSCNPKTCAPTPAEATEKETIKVSIMGEINHPQLLDLPAGTNLKEAVEIAGGGTPGGAINRVEVYQDQRRYAVDLRKETGPTLLENAIVIVPFMILTEWQTPEVVLISGHHSFPLDELKTKLQPHLKGEWVTNFRLYDSLQQLGTLDLRIGAGDRYQTFSIFRLPPERQKPVSNPGERNLYTVEIFPTEIGYKENKLTETIVDLLQELCRQDQD